MKVLVWGVLQDPPTQLVYDALLRLQADFVFIDHSEIENTSIRYNSFKHPEYYIDHSGSTFHMDDFTAAYLRPYDFTQYEQFINTTDTNMVKNAYTVHQLINNWSEHATIPIVNKPAASATNNSKLYQAMLINKAGFKVPATLVSNSKKEINDFHSRHGRLIYKSMSGVRSIVEEYSPVQLEAHKRLGLMHFQKYIEGKNVRVHVVGDKVFASIIATEGIDYRYAASSMQPYDLSPDVAAKCRQLNKDLGLILSGIDLIKGAYGDWYCLEVNTNPGFSYFDREPGNPIATAIAQMLMQLN